MADDKIYSDFGDLSQFEPIPIDFTELTPLGGGGTTCDIYKATLQYRQVFIKRLKEGLRDSLPHREAFRKEFELGANLRHRSLPQYIELHDDYLVIEWIDGRTLADMIKSDDPWLHNKRNIVRMLSELVDVVEYLHEHNVVHSDIKSDNIMITSGTHNLMLIDFDKAYTHSLSLTAGDARNYDAERSGDPAMDFHGIGMIVDRLQKAGCPVGHLKKFRKLCGKDTVTPHELREALSPGKHNWSLYMGTIAVAAIGVAVLFSTLTKENRGVNIGLETPARTDTIIIKESPASAGNVSMETNAHSSGNSEEGYKDIINREMAERMKPLMQELAQSETLHGDSLRMRMFELTELHSRTLQGAYRDYMEQFPNVPPVDVQMAVAGSKSATETGRRMSELSDRMAMESGESD